MSGKLLSVSSMELGRGKDSNPKKTTTTTKKWVVVVNVLLLFLGLGGAALLVWWALAFHRSNEQLWMVPVSLVLLGTPAITWISILTSTACRRFERLRCVTSEPQPPPPPPPSSSAVELQR